MKKDVEKRVPLQEAVAAVLNDAVLLVLGVVLVGTGAGAVGAADGAAFPVILARASPFQLLLVDALLADGVLGGGDATVAASAFKRLLVVFLQQVFDTLANLFDAVQRHTRFSLQCFLVRTTVAVLQRLHVLLLQPV